MHPTQTLLAADELLALPDDGLHHELIDGELRSMTPSGREHGIITAVLAQKVREFVVARDLGLVSVRKRAS